MTKLAVYNLEGEKVGERELNPKIFGLKTNSSLIHQVVIGLMSNRRVVSAHTKTKGEVRGGGKKPWRQKGTGRARHGSIRSPLWRGGGIIFGPRQERNFKVKINKKMRRAAMMMGLSDKVKNSALILVDKLEISEPKTKTFAKILAKLPLYQKKTLVIFPEKSDKLYLASRNLPKVSPKNLGEVDLLDILGHEVILTPVETVDKLEKIYSKV